MEGWLIILNRARIHFVRVSHQRHNTERAENAISSLQMSQNLTHFDK